jgi:hypothetical protein
MRQPHEWARDNVGSTVSTLSRLFTHCSHQRSEQSVATRENCVAMQGVTRLAAAALVLQSISAISSHSLMSETNRPFHSCWRDTSEMHKRQSSAICSRRRKLAFVIPDVEWWNSDAVGWTGSVPQEENPAHGLFEQV